MDEISLSGQFAVLGVLLILSGFFSMSETAMMACNRHRLRHAANQGNAGATLALTLLGKTDQLLGVILLGNTLINAAAAMLTGNIALRVFGEEKWALEAGALFVTFCLLVFSEITPKVAGATYPDWLTPRISFILTPLLRIAYPVVWTVNLLVTPLLRLLHLQPKPGNEAHILSTEELRSIVLESSHFLPGAHREFLVNLLDLEHITVEDIMTPRGEIESINIAAPLDEIAEKLATSFHTRLPVYEGDPGNIIGVLHMRRMVGMALGGILDQAALRQDMAGPYFIPAETPAYDQLRFFRENRQRLGLVVDEYGELLGLVTIEDIVEEVVGKFTTSMPGSETSYCWDNEGAVLVDGSSSLRKINRLLGTALPVDGPKTLNGLILEHLRDIPEIGVGLRINGVAMEVIQTEDRRVKMVKIYRP